MIYAFGFLFLGFGLIAFISVSFVNYFVVKKRSENKYHYLPTYLLLSALFISVIFILIDVLTEDLSASSGFRGLRGFLAYSSFVIYALDVIISFVSVRGFKRQFNK